MPEIKDYVVEHTYRCSGQEYGESHLQGLARNGVSESRAKWRKDHRQRDEGDRGK